MIGVRADKGIVWLGKPIISKAKDSVIIIGEHCLICSRSQQTALGVNHPVILRTLKPGAELIIGSYVRMSGTSICAGQRVVIGDRCVIGANVSIFDTDFHASDSAVRSSTEDGNSAITKPVTIGNDVFIGTGCIIMRGSKIGDKAVISAGSVVMGNIPAGMMAFGNPARVFGQFSQSRQE